MLHRRVCFGLVGLLCIIYPLVACELPPPPCDLDGARDTAPVTPPVPASSLPRKMLILSMTSGFRHDSIEAGVAAMKKALVAAGIETDATEDVARVTKANLAGYGGVVLLSATGHFLGDEGGASFEALMSFVEGGGGLLGTHSVGDAYRCGRYQLLSGGTFRSHPGNVREGKCFRKATHPAIVQLPETFSITDEFHVFYNFRPSNQVVLECLAVDGKTRLPIMWHRSLGAGRIFMSTLGHPIAYWQDQEMMQKHIVPAARWVLGID